MRSSTGILLAAAATACYGLRIEAPRPLASGWTVGNRTTGTVTFTLSLTQQNIDKLVRAVVLRGPPFLCVP